MLSLFLFLNFNLLKSIDKIPSFLFSGVLPGLVPGVRYRGCVQHALLLQQEELLGAGPLHPTLHSQILQGRTSQNFSLVLGIRDVFPGYRIRFFSLPDPGSKRFPDPGSASTSKNISILNQKNNF
jgi:hypothetical protein